jgi:hypothetical protein
MLLLLIHESRPKRYAVLDANLLLYYYNFHCSNSVRLEYVLILSHNMQMVSSLYHTECPIHDHDYEIHCSYTID